VKLVKMRMADKQTAREKAEIKLSSLYHEGFNLLANLKLRWLTKSLLQIASAEVKQFGSWL
jgi:hypothetical protein